MASSSNATGVRLRYTLKLVGGLAFLVTAMWLTYWLLFEYRVRNVLGMAAVVVLLGIPCIIAILKVPGELIALVAIWRSDDPATLDRVLGDMRERDEL
ncbi:MAG: hypothetical protein ACYTG0_31255 [Planctomycetota bacterium]|jgi:hypothetical protein